MSLPGNTSPGPWLSDHSGSKTMRRHTNLAALEALKKSLLRQAFTGEI
jgi:hypothetical protein